MNLQVPAGKPRRRRNLQVAAGKAAPELVEAWNAGEVSISAAAEARALSEGAAIERQRGQERDSGLKVAQDHLGGKPAPGGALPLAPEHCPRV